MKQVTQEYIEAMAAAKAALADDSNDFESEALGKLVKTLGSDFEQKLTFIREQAREFYSKGFEDDVLINLESAVIRRVENGFYVEAQVFLPLDHVQELWEE